jgi:hypothetical protein
VASPAAQAVRSPIEPTFACDSIVYPLAAAAGAGQANQARPDDFRIVLSDSYLFHAGEVSIAPIHYEDARQSEDPDAPSSACATSA